MPGLHGYEQLIIKGAGLTLAVGCSSMLLALVFGVLLAWAKLSGQRAFVVFAEAYTTIFRGIPELVLILLLYYGVPTLLQTYLESLGYNLVFNLSPFVSGVVTLGLIYGAFAAEVFRGAYMAVPQGQKLAAQALGMGQSDICLQILLPQICRYAIPGLANVWLVLIKATALISVIQLSEVMHNAEIAARATHKPFTCFFLASLVYLAITSFSGLGQKYLEGYAERGIRRSVF